MKLGTSCALKMHMLSRDFENKMTLGSHFPRLRGIIMFVERGIIILGDAIYFQC